MLTSIPGIGPAVAAALLADMPEFGRVDGKAAGSLIGVAPWTRESGQWKGRAFIRGDRARPRRLLYMAAGRRLGVALQPGHGPQVRRSARARQAAEGRPDGSHAQARGAGQRPSEAGPDVDPGTRARLNAGSAPGPADRRAARRTRRETVA
ncbi:MAG: transposase [Gammaproteobacteria bacterium]|nr:transposase [Gammaproteobacteria bacterium]